MKHLKTSTKVIIFGSAFLILLTVFFSFLNYRENTLYFRGGKYEETFW